MQLGAEAEGKERMEEDGGEEVAVGVRVGGGGRLMMESWSR